MTHGVGRRLREFFEANPTEELSVADAAAKFGCVPATVRAQLSTMTGSGVLERVSVYRVRQQPLREKAE